MTKIVIAGAGFGGVSAALKLCKTLPSAQITLINKTPYHCFAPDLYEVATALLKNERRLDFKNLRGTVNIFLSQIFYNKRIDILIEEIKNIDLNQKTIVTTNSKLEYDYLILALGSQSNYFGIEGAQEYSHPFKNAEDALNIRNDLEELRRLKKDGVISVVIAGGGFTGVELAGELSKFLFSNCLISILEGSPTLLAGMPEWAGRVAANRLKKLGIKVYLNHLIKKVDQTKIHCEGEEEIKYDYLIWVAGIKGENINGLINGVEFTKKGQIAVQPDLSLEQKPEVFVIGDLAQCLDKKRGCTVPSAAWAAIEQGRVAALNIRQRIERLPSQEYLPARAQFVVPVGGKFALTNILNVQIYGVVAWLFKNLVSLKYMLSILSAGQAVRLWWRGVTIYISND